MTFRRQALIAWLAVALLPRLDGGEPTSWTTGGKSILILPVSFTDAPAPAGPGEGWSNLMTSVNAYYVSQSYSNFWFSNFAVAPAINMGVNSTNFRPYVDWRTSPWLPAVHAKAKLAGYDPDAFDFEIIYTYLTNEISGGGVEGGGVGMHGGEGIWLNYSNAAWKISASTPHEIGHNLGAFHCTGFSSSSLFYPSKSGIWADEYGGYFDLMGSASSFGAIAHFCAYYKNYLGWMPDSMVVKPLTSGTYRIHAFDQGALTDGDFYAMKIQRDQANTFWFEFRQAYTNNVWCMNGLEVYGGGEYVLSSARAPKLLDMTPGSHGPYYSLSTVSDGVAPVADAPLLLGRTFSDINKDIHVTPVRFGVTSPESLDVVVRFGPFPGNQAPALSIAASTLAPATNQAVTFTATATDPDGDELAYFWEFDDPDAPFRSGIKPFGTGIADPDARLRTTATNSWMSNGVYLVRCTATDMKGGRTIAAAKVTVGTGSGLTISGVVADEAGNPIAGAIVNNWRVGSPQIQFGATNFVASGETSSNGEYMIHVRPNTTYKLMARHNGRNFICNTPGGSETGTVNVVATSFTNVTFIRTNVTCTIGGIVYLAGTGRTYNPATDGPMTIHDGNPAHDAVVASNGFWRMTVAQGRLSLTFSNQPGHVLEYGFPNPYEVMDSYTNLHLLVDITGQVASVGFAAAGAVGNDSAGTVSIPVVLTLPNGYTNATWPPSPWMACEVSADGTADYGVDFRTYGMEVKFTNNTSVFTTYVTLNVISNGALHSRTVVLTLAPLNSSTHMSAITNFTYAIIPPGSDGDTDGMPDSWEWRFANNFTNLAATADEDGDGMNNLGEYNADTDPFSSASLLRITDLQVLPAGVRVDWSGGTSAWQFIECTPEITNTFAQWTTIFTNPPPTPLNFIATDTNTAAVRHYRIRATR